MKCSVCIMCGGSFGGPIPGREVRGCNCLGDAAVNQARDPDPPLKCDVCSVSMENEVEHTWKLYGLDNLSVSGCHQCYVKAVTRSSHIRLMSKAPVPEALAHRLPGVKPSDLPLLSRLRARGAVPVSMLAGRESTGFSDSPTVEQRWMRIDNQFGTRLVRDCSWMPMERGQEWPLSIWLGLSDRSEVHLVFGPPPEVRADEAPTDLLDVTYDGVTRRPLLLRDKANQREADHGCCVAST